MSYRLNNNNKYPALTKLVPSLTGDLRTVMFRKCENYFFLTCEKGLQY